MMKEWQTSGASLTFKEKINMNKQNKTFGNNIKLIGLCMASFIGCIDFTIVNTALPAIQQAFHANIMQTQWAITAFIIALCGFMVLMGNLADKYGPTKILYIGYLNFLIASILAGITTHFFALILYRFWQGAAGAILYTATGSIIAATFPVEVRGKAMGILSSACGLGLALGPVFGGLLVGLLNWRWIFFINIPFILLAGIFCLAGDRESANTRHAHQSIDYKGAALLLVALTGFILLLSETPLLGFQSHLIQSALVITILSFILFFIVESKQAQPLINFTFFHNKQFLTGIIANFSLAFFYCSTFFLMPLYLSQVQHLSDIWVGICLLPATGLVFLLSPFTGKWTDKNGALPVLCIGFLLFLGCSLMQIALKYHDSLSLALLSLILFGAGWACILGPANTTVLSAVPLEKSGNAIGTAWTIHNLGGTVGLSCSVLVFHLSAGISPEFLSGLQGSMILLACVSLFTWGTLRYFAPRS